MSHTKAHLDAVAHQRILDFSAPTLLVDPARVQHNVDAMFARAQRAGVRLRPHFKTHQSVEIGECIRARGVSAITVSSVAMAEGFVAAGWQDLTLALPAYPAMLGRVAALLDRARVGLLVDHPEAARALAEHAELASAAKAAGQPIPVWIKIDAGYGRAGVRWTDEARIADLLQQLATSHLQPTGFLLHSGHTYDVHGREAIAAIHAEALERVLPLRERFAASFDARPQLSVGDTPSCSLLEDFGDVDEMRPGNFVFYDLSQVRIGACAPEQIAACVLCPVIGKDEARGRLILHGGSVHLSKDWLDEGDGQRSFGRLAPQPFRGEWQLPDESLRVVSLSQEHGIVKLDSARLADFRIGDFVQVFPVHSCLAADLHASYRTLDGRSLTRVR